MAESGTPAPEGISSLQAIGLMTLAVLGFAALDTTAKYLGQTLPTLQVVWIRFVTHVVLAVLIFRPWRQLGKYRTRRPVLQGVRGIFMLGATAFNFLALRHLQLAEAASIMFAAPFLVTALAGPFLGEWAGPRRWAAIIAGFLGVLVVTRPGLGGLGTPAILSVLAMTSYALYTLTTRKLTATESVESLITYTAIIPAILMAPPALAVWVWPPDVVSWALLILTGIFGGLGHWFLIHAHRHAPAPTLAPFMYSQMVWMIGLGWLVFADIPTPTTLLGAGIIIGSGLYLLFRERARKPRRAKPQN